MTLRPNKGEGRVAKTAGRYEIEAQKDAIADLFLSPVSPFPAPTWSPVSPVSPVSPAHFFFPGGPIRNDGKELIYFLLVMTIYGGIR